MAPPTWLGVLDAVSALLMLAVAASFARAARATRSALAALLAAGFVLLGVSYLSVASSEFDAAHVLTPFDALRLAGQTGGVFVVLAAYVSARVHGSAKPWFALGWAVAALSAGAAAAFLLVPPRAVLLAPETFAGAHAAQAAAWLACAGFAMEGFRRSPRRRDRVLVPAAFLSFAVGKYTWFLVDLSGADGLVPLVYVWRLLALVLLLSALHLPRREAAAEA